MRFAGPPIRFLFVVIGTWTGARVAMLLPQAAVAVAAPSRAEPVTASRDAPPAAFAAVLTPPPAVPSTTIAWAGKTAVTAYPATVPPVVPARAQPEGQAMVQPAPEPGAPAGIGRLWVDPPAVQRAAGHRWSGSAWAFVRGAGAVPLAGPSQLGGSQAGARIAYRLGEHAPVALAARVSGALDDPHQLEAAAGVDLLPTPGLRVSVERRIDLGDGGRNAWTAYAAGGFFRAVAPAVELDGYAQAGVVGTRRRDPFADATLRASRRWDVGRTVLRAGGGVWGAAQPGAARLDIGPRAAVAVPVGNTTLTAAADWRFRLTGDARPGSGPALTLSMDF